MRTGREGKKILLLVFAFSHKKEKKEKESTQILEAHKAFWLLWRKTAIVYLFHKTDRDCVPFLHF